MSKYTPGPWHIVEHSWSDTGIFAEPIAGNPRRIATLELSDDYEDSEEGQEAAEGDEFQQRADARLIAAAPELLDELKHARTIYAIIAASERSPITKQVLARVDALIAKVEAE